MFAAKILYVCDCLKMTEITANIEIRHDTVACELIWTGLMLVLYQTEEKNTLSS